MTRGVKGSGPAAKKTDGQTSTAVAEQPKATRTPKATTEERVLSGYDVADEYFAVKYEQGGRPVYDINLSLQAVALTLPRPDPLHPTEGNRRVKDSHARSFSDYLIENDDEIVPSLLMRVPDILSFERIQEVQGVQFGVLSIPRNARVDLRTIDGQHRILGTAYSMEKIAVELEKLRSLVSAAKRNNEPEVVATLQTEMERWERIRRRLATDRVSIQVHVVDDEARFKQIFVDVADNALGISSAIRARFDTRKVVNRALEEVLRHGLLMDRVDMESGRIGGTSPYWLGANHVADVVRTIYKGISGRISRREEAEIDEGALVENSNRFLTTLMDGFPALNQMAEGALMPEQLRKTSLLGSVTIIRVLAGVYKEKTGQGWEEEDFTEFWQTQVAPLMTAPVTKDSPWMKESGLFEVGASAPNARRQTVDRLYKVILQLANEYKPVVQVEGDTATEGSEKAA